ncbi:hypothetical protein TNCV_2910021 [Trichonephila clavipes]|nr:hypothetical protein TNCV_2910021 [Trichonephila clavipes]
MTPSSSFVNPTPLAHADIPRDILPRGGHHNCSPTSLVRGESRPALLIPTTKWPLAHHLEAINHIDTFPLRVCLCPDQPTLLFIQIVCDPDVRGKPKQWMMFHETSFL